MSQPPLDLNSDHPGEWDKIWDAVAGLHGWKNTGHSLSHNASFYDPVTKHHFTIAFPLTRVLLARLES